jgi:hypothetical protein
MNTLYKNNKRYNREKNFREFTLRDAKRLMTIAHMTSISCNMLRVLTHRR